MQLDNQILQDLQLFGLTENVTAKELQKKWRFLSAHTHPDRFKADTPDYYQALAKQKRLNSAKDRLVEYIASRDAARERGKENAKEIEAEAQTHTSQNADSQKIPHIRTHEVEDDVTTLSISQTLVDEICTVAIFLGTMFLGVIVACAVGAALPFVAATAPILLVVVMLVTMFGAFFKLKQFLSAPLSKIASLNSGGISRAE